MANSFFVDHTIIVGQIIEYMRMMLLPGKKFMILNFLIE
jgi:hypothetical protein